MSLRHPVVALAATAGWLLLTSGYGAAAAEPDVDLGGAPLPRGTGSASRAEPTVLEPGLWADTLGDSQTPQAEHYFRYDRQIRSSTVHVGVIGVSGDPDGDNITVDINTPDETPCDSASGSPGYVGAGTFGVRAWAGGSEAGATDEDCAAAGQLEIVVSRTAGDDELPVAIKVVEEAPATGTEDLPQPDESPSFEPGAAPAGGDGLAGATDFDDAPAVPLSDGAASFSTTVTEGEQRLYRIPLTWGQELSVEAQLPRIEAAVEEERSFVTPYVEVFVVDPMRETLDAAVDGLTSYGSPSSDDTTRLSAGLPPVEYLNRYYDDAAILPGDHWLSIVVDEPPEGADPLDVHVDIEVAVADAADAEPTYEGTVQAPDSGPGPDGYSPDTPFLIGPGQFSAVASGTPALPDAGDDGWWGPRRYAGIGLAVASLLCCGLGARRLAVARRR